MFLMVAATFAALGPDNQLLDCTVPDRRGKPTIWNVKLDQPHASVEVKVGGSSVVYRASAVYRPDSIIFDILDASVAINRADGALRRTLIGRGPRDVVEGTCIAVSSPKPERQSGS